MAIVLELHEVETLDQPGGRIAGDDIDLVVGQRAVTEREIHHVRRAREMEAVRFRESRITIRPFQKFITEPGTPAR